MGFVCATGLLHGVGISIGLVHRWTWGQMFLRIDGGVFCLEDCRMKRARLAILATATAVFCLWPPPASAHLNSTGMGPVYDGLLHFLLSPEDIVPVVALAMFAGLRGPEYGRRALFLLPASWFVGCFLGTMCKRNPARCEFTTVLGVTEMSGLVHPDQNVLNATQNSLCRAVNRRRGCCACRASSCRRSARFSRTRSSRERKALTNQPRKCRSDRIMARSLAEKTESSFAPSHSFCWCTTFLAKHRLER